MFKYLKEGYQQDGAWLFIVVPDKTRSNFQTETQKLLHCEDGRALERLPREVVEFPSLVVLKSCLDVILGNVLQVTLLEEESSD